MKVLDRLQGIKTDINIEDFIDKFLPHEISDRFYTLDGACVARYLKMIGCEVIDNYDTGHNGLAITKDGIAVSTNGYVYIKNKQLR